MNFISDCVSEYCFHGNLNIKYVLITNEYTVLFCAVQNNSILLQPEQAEYCNRLKPRTDGIKQLCLTIQCWPEK